MESDVLTFKVEEINERAFHCDGGKGPLKTSEPSYYTHAGERNTLPELGDKISS